ncbi:60S ribosomal protein L14-A, putative [Entamoeba dispar SAW760]|uniref:60S ribosomal protein L14-A, putative n=1 Tax=Entamoeba dispar (strain ATCC PRA-260 / SAW760) TaxID=370354 RepID=B0EEL7_ENTDS|nr:60S ribosomal protein L14-A, putative [Entamoeba dispar SAW760]EDR26993.1 60S ribosomal protein L14-A, putative [Entamoeba dispar SAW760]|eukprot:EDR26993.1 60S ribosomal protein L14-A, putative [Entamoeba dispar SAW760]
MVFSRFVEVGRVVLMKTGPFASKLAVIVEILDHNRVLVDGPQAITGVPRQVVNLNTISLTSFVVNKVTRGMTHKKLCLRFTQDAIIKRFNKTATGKAIEKRILREKMTDFDKFQVSIINRKINAAAKIAVARKAH